MQSRLVRIKDHLTLHRAMAILRDSGIVEPGKHLLRIAGDGEFRGELESEASKLNIRDLVEFTGMLPERELVGFLEGLDMYIHASLGETMSTAIMQAMACGLPIIASDVKGINNMISHEENGLLVPAKDAQAMAKAIERLLNDSALAARLRTAARRVAEQKFSNTRMLESYGELFRKSIK
jgi:glycosyltransferase involved in cell wall biosynthesis